MSRQRRQSFGSAFSDAHSDRPWVYFMVDCFFLIAQFFIISFNMKVEQFSLPGKIPKQHGIVCPNPTHTDVEMLPVHLLQQDGRTLYLFQSRTTTLAEFEAALERTANSRHSLSVRISYEGGVPWKSIMDVMNCCTRLGIGDIGFQPLRATEAHP